MTLEAKRQHEREIKRAWRAANRDKMKAAHEKWKRNHPGRFLELSRKSRAKNFERHKEIKLRWNAENKERVAAQRAERVARNPRALLNAELKYKFGITADQYDAMLVAQNHSCAICGLHVAQQNRRMSVDHHHGTGKVRALLCNGCNSGLGYFKENQSTLTNAIRYLNEHTANTH